jgi:hypothetical protein
MSVMQSHGETEKKQRSRSSLKKCARKRVFKQLSFQGHGNVKGRRRGDVIGQTSPDGTTSDRKSAVTDCRQVGSWYR